MTLLFQRKKTIVSESPGGENAFPFDIVSVHTQNGANQSVNFTNAANDRFLIFAINSAAAAPTLQVDGAGSAWSQTSTTTNNYGCAMKFIPNLNANITIAVNGVGVGSSVIYRLRLKAGTTATGQLANGGPPMAQTSAASATVAEWPTYQGMLYIVWDRDVEAPNPANPVAVGTETLHDFTYTYFRGKLFWRSSVGGKSSPPANTGPTGPTTFTGLTAVYGCTICCVSVR